MIKRWFDEYKSISKLSYVSTNNYGKNLSAFKKYLIMAGIEKIGASTIFNIVDSHPDFKAAPKVKYDIKKMLRSLISDQSQHKVNDAMLELDRKILEILQNVV
jgi:DNA gyrase inhibitor GyrI